MYDVIVVGARCAGSSTARLLARRGYRVLLVDKATFPSDTLSTHYIHQPGIARLHRWGLLDRLRATGCPPIYRGRFDVGPFALTGSPLPAGEIAEAYCPRRYVLDKLLVDAAVEAAAYNTKPSLTCGYYTCWSGVPVEGLELYLRERRFILVFPTHHNLACIAVGWPREEFRAFRADIEANYLETLELAPGLAERVRAGRREERFAGTADVPNFFRKPSGPGWALVGDAGYHKDPCTGQGISDAFRDAELLAEAIDDGFSGRRTLDEALADYERRRNEATTPMYEYTCQLAALHPLSPRQLRFYAALRTNPGETDRFFGVLAGTVPLREFFSIQNIQRILGAAPRGAAAG